MSTTTNQLNVGRRVRVEKIEQLKDSPLVNITDWFEGDLALPVEKGKQLWLDPLRANSQDPSYTYFHTSPVVETAYSEDHVLVTTRNSVYRLTFV